MGVIKGSIASADTLRSLSLEQYLSTSERSAPTFTTELERTQIYDIYERYEKFKSDQGDIDQADRVANLLREMKTTPGLSNTLQQAFQELYIDGKLLM
jgi:superfamily I DNA/RNA helicase